MTSSAPLLTPGSARGLPVGLGGDERLARLVGQGHERAFAALYDRYHQQIYRYVRAMVRHEPDAQDVLQSAFAKAFVALAEGRRDAPLRPWLYRVAHNEAISTIRRRRPELNLTAAGELPAPSVDQVAGERARLAMLVADLQALTPRQRGALVMRELCGLSHEEIEAALGLDPGAAKQTIFEARRSLAAFSEGRDMSCDEVCRAISDTKGRTLRGRKIRAHLRDCSACEAFAAAIPARARDLRAIAPPLPAAAAAGLLTQLLGHGGSGGASAGGATGGVAAKLAALGTASKAATAVAVVAVTAGAGGVVVPLLHPGAPSGRRPASLSGSRATGGPAPLPGAARTQRGTQPGPTSPSAAITGSVHPHQGLAAARPPARLPGQRHRTGRGHRIGRHGIGQSHGTGQRHGTGQSHGIGQSHGTGQSPSAGQGGNAGEGQSNGQSRGSGPSHGAAVSAARSHGRHGQQTSAAHRSSHAHANGPPSSQSHGPGASHGSSAPTGPAQAPGHSGGAPGHSGGAPGHSGGAPGHSGDAPGHSGDAPGHSGDAPGHGSAHETTPAGQAPAAPATTSAQTTTAETTSARVPPGQAKKSLG